MAAPQKNELPGLGLPIKFPADANRFAKSPLPTALNEGWASSGVTLREQRMMAFIDTITDKPGWEEKVFDEFIVAKWREEAKVGPDTDDSEDEQKKESGDEDEEGDGEDENTEPDEVFTASQGEDEDEEMPDTQDSDGGENGSSDGGDEDAMADSEGSEEDDGSNDDADDVVIPDEDDESDNEPGEGSDAGSQSMEVRPAGEDSEDVYMTPKMFNFVCSPPGRVVSRANTSTVHRRASGQSSSFQGDRPSEHPRRRGCDRQIRQCGLGDVAERALHCS